MRILFYLRHFPLDAGALQGGTARAVGGLATALAGLGQEVFVLSEAQTGESRRNGYRVLGFRGPRHHRAMRVGAGLRRWLQQSVVEGDVPILNGIFHPGVYAVACYLHHHHHPYWVAPHDPYAPAIFRHNSWLKRPYWWLFERRLLARATGIVLLDRTHARYLRARGIRTPTLESGNGYEPDEVPPMARLTWRRWKPIRIGYLGRIAPWNKGLDLLLQAAARLPQPQPRIEMRGLGSTGSAARSLRAMAQGLGLDCRILPPDWTRSGSELAAEFDLFCLPSRFEGFGLAALEAMLAARPLLVSNVGGIARHVAAAGCGVVVEPNVSALHQGLWELLEKRLHWRRMGLAGRSYALEHLSWSAAAHRLLAGLEIPVSAQPFPTPQSSPRRRPGDSSP